jgi:hypothetical protein
MDEQGLISSRGRDFFVCHHMQTGSRAHPTSYPVGTGGKPAGA